MMARIGWLFISFLFCNTITAQYYPYKVAAKKDTVAIIKKVGGVNATTIGDIVKLGDTSNINELQVIDTFTMVNDTLRLSISKDGEKYKAVPILGFDKQKADTFLITSNQLRLSLERDGVPFYSVNLAPYLDNTDGQTLSIAGNTLSISGGNAVTLPIANYTAGTGINITGNVISNTGDLSNSNELQVYSHSGTTSYTNTLSLSGGSFSIIAGTNMAISHNGSGVITLNASTGSNTNIYNSNGSLTANRIVSLAGYNMEFNGTGNLYLNNSGRIGLFLNSTPFTAFSNSATGVQDGNANNAAVDGILWQSYGSGYAFTSYSGFSHGLHTRINSTLAAYKILNCSSGSTATDRFTVFGNGVVRIQGLPNAQCLATNSSGDVVASTFPNQIQTYGHSGTSSYTNTLSIGGGSFSLLAGTGIGISHNGSGAVTISNSGSSANIYNTNGLLIANRTVGLNGYNLEFNGTGNTYLNCSRVGLFVNSTPYTAFSNSTTGISDGSSNNAAIDGTLWQSFGSGYAGTYYSGFSHGFHARTNGTTTLYKILNCSSGSTATDRFTVYGNGTVRIQGLPNVSILGTNANGDLIASSFSGNYWGLTGNTGTSPTTNYIGTVDAQDFVVKTQATEVLRFKVGGMIGQGTSSPSFPYHMYMTGSNGFRRESSGATIRDSWKISASDFYAEYTTIGVPKATYKLYGSANFDGGVFIEDDCSRSIFGLNFIRFTSHTNNRNDIPTTAIKNTLYTDNAGNLMSSPVHCVSQNASSSSVLQTVSKVINVPTSSTVFLGIAAMENNGQVIYLKRNPASAGTGQVKISSSNGTLIDGATEYYLNTTVSGVIMVYNSLVPGWFIHGKF